MSNNLRNFTDWKPPLDRIEIEKVRLDDTPYIHVDVWATDVEYGELVFGVPLNHKKGLAYYIIDNEKIFKIDRPTYGDDIKCPLCSTEMLLTKTFKFTSPKRHQYKCPNCYLTKYKGGNKIINKSELTDRLKRMGYLK